MILREPATALDPRVRTKWLVENLLFTGLVAALVVGGTVAAAMLDATAAAWFVGGLGGLAVVALAALSAVGGLDYRHFRYEVTDLGPLCRPQLAVAALSGRPARARADRGHDVRAAHARLRPRRRGGENGLGPRRHLDPGLTPEVADRLVEELARRAGIEEGT